uniref:Uncharacterized protein n=1 Tax=Rhizophora mucronata TaxID=61149 RepID=A0A2P2LTM8_RHIMU
MKNKVKELRAEIGRFYIRPTNLAKSYQTQSWMRNTH